MSKPNWRKKVNSEEYVQKKLLEQRTLFPKMTIRQARKAKGMVQHDLARLVGLPQLLISYVEMGVVNVPLKDRPKWECALGSINQILWPE